MVNLSTFQEYLTIIIFIAGLIIAISSAIHVAMTKKDVRAAIAWVGIIILTPFLGSFLYLIAGINRIRINRRILLRRRKINRTFIEYQQRPDHSQKIQDPALLSLINTGDGLPESYPLTYDNQIKIYWNGHDAYSDMLEAIKQAKHSIVLQSYIFDNDVLGRKFAQALIDAHNKGVNVRVLIDGIGVNFKRPNIMPILEKAGITVSLFGSHTWVHITYANLRCHRKILVVDCNKGFSGCMNLREDFDFTLCEAKNTLRDAHCQVVGPAVNQLVAIFIKDWEYATDEQINSLEWQNMCEQKIINHKNQSIPARFIASGPDLPMLSTHTTLLAALSIAQKKVFLQSPYFLPDAVLLGAINIAARRGVQVNIIIPGQNNIRLVHYAMMAQIDQVLESGCRVWMDMGNFNHAKLATIDDKWSLIGSTNLDPRSLRLNFEVDLEIYDQEIAQEISAKIHKNMRQSIEVNKLYLKNMSWWRKLRNKLIWLASPYL